MLVLFETSAGFAVFKLLDEKKLAKSENVFLDFETPEKAHKLLKLKQLVKFKDTTEALAAATSSIEGKMSKTLKSMLKKLFVKEAHETLAVAEAKLGNTIKEKYSVNCVYNSAVHELMRCIRSHQESLISDITQKETSAMSLGLAHSLSRYKLKFSPDKVDTMIIQAVGHLDDLDKELNNYIMRCREWYGWHFPELGKIIADNVTYVKTVKLMQTRERASSTDFSDILTEEQEQLVKENAEISMGTEISEEDTTQMVFLCDQVIEMSLYRTQLFEYLQNRMNAIAPNLTALVGELVGARLVAHAGSLLNLAKHPASTVQILGAEKALFRALKAKHDTPKYGLIYHAQLIGQSNAKLKGKMARMLAAKAALAIRVDALGDTNSSELGIEQKARLEIKLKHLEEGGSRRISGTGRQSAKFDVYQNKSHVQEYKPAQDNSISMKREADPGTPGPSKKKFKADKPETPSEDVETPTSEKKKKKKKKVKVEEAEEEEPVEETSTVEASPEKKKKKKKIKKEVVEETAKEEEAAEEEEEEKPKKKKKKQK